MKTKHIIILSILLLIALIPSLIMYGSNYRIRVNDGPVVFYRDSLEIDPIPRTLGICPFYAEYYSGNVYLSSTSSIGTVSVEVTSTAGDNYVTFFDTSEGEIILPVSGEPGYYLLRITVSADEHYIGRFELGLRWQL